MSTKSRFLLWILIFTIICWRTLPFLTAEIPAGWDTLGHYYLSHLMLKYLSEFHLSGYDLQWLGGYPAFTLYPPLFYIIVASIHLVSFGLISLTKAFQIFIFIQPFLFLVSTFLVTRTFFSQREAYYALLSGFIFLFLGLDYSFFKIGLVGNYFIGVNPCIFGLNLFLLFLGSLGQMNKCPSWKITIPNICLLTAIILTHTLTTIFTFWTILIFGLCYFRTCWKRILSSCIISLTITAFWWIPFLEHLAFSSSDTISLSSISPLYVILPEIKISSLRAIFSYPLVPIEVHIPLFNDQYLSLNIRGIFVAFPLSGILFGISLLVASLNLVQKRQIFIVLLFIISLLFLPNSYFSEIFNLGIHYYRFVEYIVAIEAILLGVGFVIIQDFCHQRFSKFKNIFSLLILLSLIQTILFKLDWHSPNKLRISQSTENPKFQFDITKYKSFPDTYRVIQYFQKPINGRIAIEANANGITKDGSPHLLSSLIPIMTKAEVIPGLIVESSLASVFINSTLGVGSNHLVWGKNNIYHSELFRSHPPKTILKWLKLYNVEYLISNSKEYFDFLQKISLETKQLELVLQTGDYGVFKLTNLVDKIYHTKYLPWLFYSDDLDHFRLFSEFWFSGAKGLDLNIIYDTSKEIIQDLLQLKQISSDLSGLIIFADRYSESDWIKKIADLHSITDKPIVVLTERDNLFLPEELKNQFQVMNIKINKNDKIFNLIKKLSRPQNINQPVVIKELLGNKISYQSLGATVIGINFAPKWRFKELDTKIFLVAPSQMLTLSAGNINLEYD